MCGNPQHVWRPRFEVENNIVHGIALSQVQWSHVVVDKDPLLQKSNLRLVRHLLGNPTLLESIQDVA